MVIFIRIYKKILQNGLVQKRGTRVIFFAILLNVLFGSLFYLAERNAQDGLTLVDSIWWAMVTMTTVGYGDFYAETALGRFIISYPCMLVGIGIIGYLVGSVAETMLDHVSKKKRGLMPTKSKDHIIVCNYPHLDKVVRLVNELQLSYLYKDKEIVLVTDAIQELPEQLKALGIQFVQGDPVREDILLRANINQAAGVFVLARNPGDPSSDEKTFAIGTIVELIERDNGRPIRTVVEVVNKDNIKMMQRANVDGIVSADGIMDGLIVQEFLNPGVHTVVHQMLTNAVGSQFYIMDTALIGKSMAEIQTAMLNYEKPLQLIGLVRDKQTLLSPPKDTQIQEKDQLIIIAEHRSHYQMFEKDALKSA